MTQNTEEIMQDKRGAMLVSPATHDVRGGYFGNWLHLSQEEYEHLTMIANQVKSDFA